MALRQPAPPVCLCYDMAATLTRMSFFTAREEREIFEVVRAVAVDVGCSRCTTAVGAPEFAQTVLTARI